MASRITVCAPRPAPWFTPVFVAIDKGFLAEEGLEPEIRYNVDLDQLGTGEVDYIVTGAGRGRAFDSTSIRMICGHATRDTGHVLMVRPEFETVHALEHIVMDKTEGLVNELRNILSHHGLDLGQADIAMTRVDGHPQQYELLNDGVGDAAPVGPPWWIFLAKKGYRNMGGEADETPLSGSGVFVSPEKLERDPQQAAAFVRAYVRAIAYCQENRAGTLETMLKYSSAWGVDSPEIASEVYDVVAPFWTHEINLGSVEKLLALTATKLGTTPERIDRFVDLRFLNEALAK